jgi:hypothetical protein
MTSDEALRQQILDAHERGDTVRLAQLQERYRTRGVSETRYLERGRLKHVISRPGAPVVIRQGPIVANGARVTGRPRARTFAASTTNGNGATLTVVEPERAPAADPAPPLPTIRTVTISRTAKSELDAALADADGEIGGGLYGHIDTNEIWISGVSVNVQPGSSFRGTCTLDTAAINRRAILRNDTLLGDWHSHPSEERVADPSDNDLKGWAAGLRRSSSGYYLGLIASPAGPERYAAHHLTAFVLSRGSDGKLVPNVLDVNRQPPL